MAWAGAAGGSSTDLAARVDGRLDERSVVDGRRRMVCVSIEAHDAEAVVAPCSEGPACGLDALLGVSRRALSAHFGPHRPEASWVVSAETGLPTGYDQAEWHPALLSRGEIISSGRALMLRMAIHRGKAPI